MGHPKPKGWERERRPELSLPCCSCHAGFSQFGCCWGRVGALEAPIRDCSPALSVAGTNSEAVPMVEVALENDLVRCPCFIPVCCHAGRAPASAETWIPPSSVLCKPFPRACLPLPSPSLPFLHQQQTLRDVSAWAEKNLLCSHRFLLPRRAPTPSHFSEPAASSSFSVGKTIASPGCSTAKHPDRKSVV